VRAPAARPAFAAAAGLAALLGGCALSPDRMEILVDTTPPGAACVLERQGQPLAALAPTPAIALVDASEAEIIVRCRRDGFAEAAATLHPRPRSPAVVPLWGAAPGPSEQRVDIALIPRSHVRLSK
jgi:hypothetical protein